MKIFGRHIGTSGGVRSEPSFPEPKRRGPLRIADRVISWAKQRSEAGDSVNIFKAAHHPPSVFPSGIEKSMAMDEALGASTWAASAIQRVYADGLTFLGYAYLAELAQRPEYRKIVETISTEMTRKWIKIQSTGEGENKTKKVKLLTNAMDRFHVRDVFRKAASHDGFFGRGHIYIDLGTTDDRDELKTSIGTGTDQTSKAKISKGGLKAFRAVEPVWCYPTDYNSNDPLRPDWYKPKSWFVQGKQVHASRLLTLVGREVPDLLKPAYSFGGLSMSQMAKPYVENFIRTRQSVSDLIHSFSVSGVRTNLSEIMQGDGDQLFKRIALFNDCRDNRGAMILDKDTEEFFNVATPLGTLDKLQAQSQEQIASVASIPLVKLLGITPSGLNASSDGEVRCFYDWIHAYQEHLLSKDLDRVFGFIQLSEFGEIDPDLTYKFEPLWALNEKEIAELKKTEAETDQMHIDSGVIQPIEARQRVASDPESPYASLDSNDVPDLKEEEEEGLVLRGEEGEAALERDDPGRTAA